MIKTIEYHCNGITFSDHEVEGHARGFLLGKANSICVANELFITAARTLIAEKVIPHTEVEFLFKGETIPVDCNGRLPEYPYGFCDTNEQLLMRLLQ